MIARGQNFKQVPLKIVGSSSFGRYPKISIEKTYNMFISDNWLVPYPGYKTIIDQSQLGQKGRGIHASTKLNKLIVVVDNKVYLIDIIFNQATQTAPLPTITNIGTLNTASGIVYITENNKPQIVISDGTAIYLYDETLTPKFRQLTGLNFTPGYIDFHDSYILCAASNDSTYTPEANNTWRLGTINTGSGVLEFPSDANHVGLIQTKPDNTQGIIRFPSKGNMIFVFGETVTEAWFDTGSQLFPYQRNNQFNIDYGLVSPSTLAATDEIVVWLAQNEKSGPIIMYSNGGMPKKITTDGIDYLFSQLTNPSDSRAFIIRQDGHLIYHINFFTDNLSLFYDFNTGKFFHACDENLNYFIADQVAFFNNQYYFVSPNNGNLYAFDTIFTTYDGAEIPRFRICQNIRDPDQQYRICNDVGFTIETGETDYIYQNQNGTLVPVTPMVEMSMSTDGGSTFGSDYPYILNPIGKRKNRLMWWNLGAYNDLVLQFKFWGIGRFVVTDGLVSIRQ